MPEPLDKRPDDGRRPVRGRVRRVEVRHRQNRGVSAFKDEIRETRSSINSAVRGCLPHTPAFVQPEFP